MSLDFAILGFLNYQPFTGYDLKKIFDNSVHHFWTADQSQIYRTLTRLTQQGLAQVQLVEQVDRPDRKVYSITPAGRTAFIASLLKPLPEDRHRSPFVFAMLFADLLPTSRVSGMLDSYIAQVEEKLAHLNSQPAASQSKGEQFVSGFGRAVYVAILDFLRAHRAEVEQQHQRPEAAE